MENRRLLDENKRLKEELEKVNRPPLRPVNGRENIPQKVIIIIYWHAHNDYLLLWQLQKPAREQPHGKDPQLYHQQEN